MALPDRSTIRARLYSQVEADPVTGCIVFTGCWDREDSPRFRVGYTVYRARKVAAWVCGKIADLYTPLLVYRKCQTPACIAPEHIAVARTWAAMMKPRRKLRRRGRFRLTKLRLDVIQGRLDDGDTVREIAADLEIRPARLARALVRRSRKHAGRSNRTRDPKGDRIP